MSFAIDTPNHKRWRLPDGRHWYNTFIYGDDLVISIIDGVTRNTVLSLPVIKLSNPQWQDLAETAQALAEKKFRAQTRQERQNREYQRSYLR